MKKPSLIFLYYLRLILVMRLLEIEQKNKFGNLITFLLLQPEPNLPKQALGMEGTWSEATWSEQSEDGTPAQPDLSFTFVKRDYYRETVVKERERPEELDDVFVDINSDGHQDFVVHNVDGFPDLVAIRETEPIGKQILTPHASEIVEVAQANYTYKANKEFEKIN